jgi:hypothetical protein
VIDSLLLSLDIIAIFVLLMWSAKADKDDPLGRPDRETRRRLN